MKINEMNNSRKNNVKKALKEHFEVNMHFEKLKLSETTSMLKRVRGLITETRTSKSAHSRHQNPAYLKLVMLEQALSDHYRELKVHQRIMLENEEVQKSQVILAAQDMIDSIQKMIEQISKMKVEELPAVVTGVNNEIGTSEGSQFESTTTEALTSLEGALTTAKSSLTSAMGQITGEATAEPDFNDAGELPDDTEVDAEVDTEIDDFGGDEGQDDGSELPELPEPEEEPEQLGGAGRDRR